jgi:RHS repeat-associated protein
VTVTAHANRLTQVTQGSVTAQYVYNGDGVRTSKTVAGDTTEYALDLLATLPVVISDTDAVYLYGLDIVAEQQTERLYYLHDGLGSVRQLVDTTGQVEANYAYDPFGVPVAEGDESNPYRYTGEAWDGEVELLYLRAKYYQPGTGRFVTRDPWVGDTRKPGTLDAYLYALDNPVNLVDPTGHNSGGSDPLGLQDLELAHGSGPSSSCSVRSLPCIPISDDPAPTWEVRAQNPGRGLLFEGTAIHPPRRMSFLNSQFGGATLESGLEVRVRVYANGAYVEVRDTYDTTNMVFSQILAPIPGMMYRYGTVVTTQGQEVNFYFVTVERQNVGIDIVSLPFLTVTLFKGPVKQGPLDLVPSYQRGRGEATAWLGAREGTTWYQRYEQPVVPEKVRMFWGITESPEFTGFNSLFPHLGSRSYEASLLQIYGDMRINACPAR